MRAQADLTLKHFGTLCELTGSDEQGQQLFEEVKMVRDVWCKQGCGEEDGRGVGRRIWGGSS